MSEVLVSAGLGADSNERGTDGWTILDLSNQLGRAAVVEGRWAAGWGSPNLACLTRFVLSRYLETVCHDGVAASIQQFLHSLQSLNMSSFLST